VNHPPTQSRLDCLRRGDALRLSGDYQSESRGNLCGEVKFNMTPAIVENLSACAAESTGPAR